MSLLDPKPVTQAGLDAKVRDHINNPASATATALSATIATATDAKFEHGRTPALSRFYQRLSAGRYRPQNVVAVGSSSTRGAYSTSLDRRYVNVLGDNLHRRFNPSGLGGRHYLATDTGWTTTGTITTAGRGLGFESRDMAAGATLSRTIPDCTGFTVLFEEGSATQGTFTVTIDGGTPATVTPSQVGGGGRPGFWKVSGLARGSHTILITATTAQVINSVYAHDGDELNGVRVWNAGLGGASTSALSNPAFASVGDRIIALDTALVILQFGSNDYAAQMPIDTFKANIAAFIAQVRAGAPETVFLLLGQYRRFDVTTPAAISWDSYLAAMSDMAEADPDYVAFLNYGSSFPANQASDPAGVYDSDGIHMTDWGHAMTADLIMGALTPQAAGATIGQLVTPAPSSGTYDILRDSRVISDFDAATLALSNGAAVASWAPSRGSENLPLAQATAGQRPTYKVAGVGKYPAVAFAKASTQAMDTGAWSRTFGLPLTVFALARIFPSEATSGFVYTGRNGVFVNFGTGAAAGTVEAGTAAASTSKTGIADGWYLSAVVYNGATSRWYFHALTSTTFNAGNTGATALPGLKLGTTSSGTAGLINFELARLIAVAGQLTDAEVKDTMQALATRYGLTLGA